MCEGKRVGMGDGQQRRAPAHDGQPACCAAVQPQLRGATVANNLNVSPQNALRVARAERLHRGFLGREAAGEVDRRILAAQAVRDLAVGEETMGKPITVAFDGVGDAADVGGIEPESDDVHVAQA